jgi:valyl-tRNA synthetase
LQRLGCSCDWSRLRFTLDSGPSSAVREVFVSLHEQGLIYREETLINWCPSCRTALSDLEVNHRDEEGSLWHIAYPVKGSDRQLVVATTRPETMLGDTGVAVHPEDERYRALIGGTVLLPLVEREIPVVADSVLVDSAFGTGVVKVTPGHDFNDFAAGRRNGLPTITIFDETGRVNENGGPYAGLDRFEARKRIVLDLEERGLVVKVEGHQLPLAVCQRCGSILEPRLSTQWFVRVAPLAAPALEAVKDGRIEMVPASWKKTYFEWMRNIHDWCISRQLWWGHRIPAWYCPDGHITVARHDPDACSTCGKGSLKQDEDVLDTWFSSALWPFSTLGWPDETEDLARYYPTAVLSTAPDILFFWVARMVMMGLKFRGEVPFRAVYLHGLVRDEKGQKMSKTRGNVVEPEELQTRYGTDAVRFTLAAGASPGPGVSVGADRLEGYQAFANKIWNAARFVLMNLREEEGQPVIDEALLAPADRWIRSRASRLAGEVNGHLEEFRFDLAAGAIYQFAWYSFCDWYIELAKQDLGGGPAGSGVPADDARGRTARGVLVETFDTLLRLLHPIMPFLTEELWQKLPRLPGGPISISIAPFPVECRERHDAVSEATVEELIEVVTRARNLRAEAGLDSGRKLDLRLASASAEAREALAPFLPQMRRLTNAGSVEIVGGGPAKSAPSLRAVAGRFDVAIVLSGEADMDAIATRLRRDMGKVEADLAARRRKLGNPSFTERAPAEVVEKERQIAAELDERRARLAGFLAGLGPAA